MFHQIFILMDIIDKTSKLNPIHNLYNILLVFFVLQED